MKVDEIILATASGTMVTTIEERKNGVLVLDIGRGTTDFVLYREGIRGSPACCPSAATTSPTISRSASAAHQRPGRGDEAAPRFRRHHLEGPREKVWLNGDFAIGDRHFPRQAVEQITSLRIVELLEVVKKKLGPAFVPEMPGAGVVLTGGTSKLMATDEAATAVFGLPARRGDLPTNLADELRDPGYSTVLGLLFYGLTRSTSARPSPGPPRAA